MALARRNRAGSAEVGSGHRLTLTGRSIGCLPETGTFIVKPEVANAVVQQFKPEVDAGVVFNRNLSLGLFLTGSGHCCTKPEVAIGCCFEPKFAIVVLHNRKLLLFIG